MQKKQEKLIKSAKKARESAFAPYSEFKVGAAVLTKDGETFTGCNVESATYGLTVCAERVAIWKAISENVREFSHIAVVADTEKITPPCGACRQIIWEFCGDIPVVMANLQGDIEVVQMMELLPRAFDNKFLA